MLDSPRKAPEAAGPRRRGGAEHGRDGQAAQPEAGAAAQEPQEAHAGHWELLVRRGHGAAIPHLPRAHAPAQHHARQ